MSDSKTEYTPSVDRAGELYSWAYAWRVTDGEGESDLSDLRASRRAEFDRMIARVRAEAQVEALREVATKFSEPKVLWYGDGGVTVCEDYPHLGNNPRVNTWLHDRADRIASEAGIERVTEQ